MDTESTNCSMRSRLLRSVGLAAVRLAPQAQVLVALLLESGDHSALELRLALVGGLANLVRLELGDDGALVREPDRLITWRLLRHAPFFTQ
jgi:hypothetical protein